MPVPGGSPAQPVGTFRSRGGSDARVPWSRGRWPPPYAERVLSTLLAEVPWLAFGVLVAVVVLAPSTAPWLLRHRRVAGGLLIAAAVVVAGLTLYPDGAPGSAVTCAVEWPYLAPTAVESTANVLLFVVPTFLLAVWWRRPLVAIGVGVGTSAVIEAVQALVPAIGRACDTGDWVTNGIGAVIGGAVAAVGLVWARRRGAVSGVSEARSR